MQMPFPLISTTPLPYHIAFLCTVTQGIFLVATDCPNLKTPSTVQVYSNSQSLLYNTKSLKTFQLGPPKKSSLHLISFSLKHSHEAMLSLNTLYWLFLQLETWKGSHSYSMHTCFFKGKKVRRKGVKVQKWTRLVLQPTTKLLTSSFETQHANCKTYFTLLTVL